MIRNVRGVGFVLDAVPLSQGSAKKHDDEIAASLVPVSSCLPLGRNYFADLSAPGSRDLNRIERGQPNIGDATSFPFESDSIRAIKQPDGHSNNAQRRQAEFAIPAIAPPDHQHHASRHRCYRDPDGAVVDRRLGWLPDPRRYRTRKRLAETVPIMLAFLGGTIAGAAAGQGAGVVCLVLPVAMLAGLTMLAPPPLRIA